MNKALDDLSKQIINDKIDIEALNEFLEHEENENNFMINNNGQIIEKKSRIRMGSEENDEKWLYRIYNKV